LLRRYDDDDDDSDYNNDDKQGVAAVVQGTVSFHQSYYMKIYYNAIVFYYQYFD
jgi:hypothetical protein